VLYRDVVWAILPCIYPRTDEFEHRAEHRDPMVPAPDPHLEWSLPWPGEPAERRLAVRSAAGICALARSPLRETSAGPFGTPEAPRTRCEKLQRR
jgi:hypothetical protein